MTCQQVTREVWRDIQRSVCAAFAHLAFELVQILHFTHYAERLCVHEPIDQLAALDGAILIENEHRHVFYVTVESVAKRDHLDQRREEKEKQCQRIAPDDDEFLEQNRAKSAKRFVFHLLRPAVPGHCLGNTGCQPVVVGSLPTTPPTHCKNSSQ